MASFNKVILVGNLTRDPEVRVTPSGLSICKIGLAVNRRYRDKDGNDREEATYVDIDSFGKQAEVLGKYLSKGRPLFVEGRLQLDTWESQSGEKRSKLKVVLENFQFLGGRSDNDSSSESYDRSSSASSSQESSQVDEDIEDVPF